MLITFMISVMTKSTLPTAKIDLYLIVPCAISPVAVVAM